MLSSNVLMLLCILNGVSAIIVRCCALRSESSESGAENWMSGQKEKKKKSWTVFPRNSPNIHDMYSMRRYRILNPVYQRSINGIPQLDWNTDQIYHGKYEGRPVMVVFWSSPHALTVGCWSSTVSKLVKSTGQSTNMPGFCWFSIVSLLPTLFSQKSIVLNILWKS